MKVTKFPQSHLVLEKNGKKIIIDPGNLTFEGGYMIEEFQDVDGFLITHIHNDHMGDQTIKELVGDKPIFGNQEVVDKLETLGVLGTAIKNREKFSLAGFEIEAVELPHFKIPGGEPQNTGFLIDGALFHGGDGFKIEEEVSVENAALAVGHPALSLLGALELAKDINAKTLIPIHYDKFPRNLDELKFASEAYGLNIKIIPLDNGEETEI